MIPTINLPENEKLRLDVWTASKVREYGEYPADKRSAMSHAAGHIIMATALGYKVTHARLTQIQSPGAIRWDCLIDLDSPLVYKDEDSKGAERHLMLLKAALYFRAGFEGELFDIVAHGSSALNDRFWSEFLCEHLDDYINLPDKTTFYRVVAFAEKILADNFGVFAGLLFHLDTRDDLTEYDLSLCLPAVEVHDVTELLGGLQ
ncbi:MAG: hypothetical protein Q8S55_09085 [Methylococcaceae bacterium]|nr:hypothetical protein [Methylococcaceae bacterium]